MRQQVVGDVLDGRLQANEFFGSGIRDRIGVGEIVKSRSAQVCTVRAGIEVSYDAMIPFQQSQGVLNMIGQLLPPAAPFSFSVLAPAPVHQFGTDRNFSKYLSDLDQLVRVGYGIILQDQHSFMAFLQHVGIDESMTPGAGDLTGLQGFTKSVSASGELLIERSICLQLFRGESVFIGPEEKSIVQALEPLAEELPALLGRFYAEHVDMVVISIQFLVGGDAHGTKILLGTLPVLPVQAAVLNRLCHVRCLDLNSLLQVCDGARHSPDPVIGTCR